MPWPKADKNFPVSHARLLELVSYDKETGMFTRLVSTSPRAMAGTVGESVDGKGYLRISVEGRRYLMHRLAWFYVTGEWPKDEIDHRNTNRKDNRWENLRLADTFTNKRNTRPYRSNKSGLKGVSWHVTSKKWRSRIRIDGKEVVLGMFDTPEEANRAYADAAEKHFGEYARAA